MIVAHAFSFSSGRADCSETNPYVRPRSLSSDISGRPCLRIRPLRRHNCPAEESVSFRRNEQMRNPLFRPAPTRRLPHLAILLLVSLPLAAVSCTGSRPGGGKTERSPPAEQPVSGDSLAQLRALVTEVVGDSTCTRDAQCKTIAFGSKPCGGPWSYLVYSTATTDSARLDAVVQRYNAYEDSLNRAEGRFSDCMLVQQPPVACQQGRCVEPD